ncbi:hypothetical protein ACFLWN_03480 [Chloroflexota bacterium]
MRKIGLIILTLGITIFAYIFLTLIMPTFITITNTANTTMAATSNMSNYSGTAEALTGSPLWLYFVPAELCGVAIVGILKGD